MATFQSFEEIDAWKEARKLIKQIRLLCKQQPVCRDFSFVDQITRASRSIAANIAEGFEALTHKEFIVFLSYAKRSAGEVRSHLYDALDEGYIDQAQFHSLTESTRHISRMLARLIVYLRTKT